MKTVLILFVIIGLCIIAMYNQGILSVYEDGSFEIVGTAIGGCLPFGICN